MEEERVAKLKENKCFPVLFHHILWLLNEILGPFFLFTKIQNNYLVNPQNVVKGVAHRKKNGSWCKTTTASSVFVCLNLMFNEFVYYNYMKSKNIIIHYQKLMNKIGFMMLFLLLLAKISISLSATVEQSPINYNYLFFNFSLNLSLIKIVYLFLSKFKPLQMN